MGGESDSIVYYGILRALSDFGSGVYRFSVQATAMDESKHSSAEIRSEAFTYTKPDKTLAACSNVAWSQDHNQVSWQAPEDEDLGGFTVKLYYRRWDTGAWKLVSSDYLRFDLGQIDNSIYPVGDALFARNGHRAGYYAFSVTSEPKDITTAVHSAESEMSDLYYYYYRP